MHCVVVELKNGRIRWTWKVCDLDQNWEEREKGQLSTMTKTLTVVVVVLQPHSLLCDDSGNKSLTGNFSFSGNFLYISQLSEREAEGLEQDYDYTFFIRHHRKTIFYSRTNLFIKRPIHSLRWWEQTATSHGINQRSITVFCQHQVKNASEAQTFILSAFITFYLHASFLSHTLLNSWDLA